MSKELTEQWRNGTLEDGYYYVKENNEVFISPCSKGYLKAVVLEDCEVLAQVPTYAEFKDLMSNLQYVDKCRELTEKVEQLEKQLEEAERLLVELHWQVKGDLLQRSIDYFEKYGVEE